MAVSCIEMPLNDWIDLKDNPRQRDTQRRAKRAIVKHLKQYQKVHRFVFAATKDGSVICKLDGHTRAFLWGCGELSPPPEGTVIVNLIEVKSMAEAKMIYDQLDSQPSVKKPSDTVFGACRENGFRLNSHLLRGCSFATQLKIATSGKRFTGDIYKMVAGWKHELLELDSWEMTSNYTILIAVMLTAARRDGHTAKEFFKRLDMDEGVKTSKGYDGVQLLHELMLVRRSEGRTAGYENLMQICGQAWTAYELFKANKIQKRSTLKMQSFTDVVASLVKDKAGS